MKDHPKDISDKMMDAGYHAYLHTLIGVSKDYRERRTEAGENLIREIYIAMEVARLQESERFFDEITERQGCRTTSN